ncbi:acyltransferase family protein [Arthrobacter sp. AOP36-A1-22]|uniref:acyltransferase family protein n=1 Tax=unclassified Arthrobacter TaxID=235627 RepID=UPI0026507053|nr:acyltransferase [Micrococcaceae bacterium]MDN5823919.1 acyltransferase [Micrococcaceae bacterium]
MEHGTTTLQQPAPAGTDTTASGTSASTATPSRPPRGKGRMALLDGLRLVAAVGVILYHYTAWHHGYWGVEPAKAAWPYLSRLTVFGNMGVQLFFVISGFVILLSAYGKRPAQFIGSRVGRLFPAYWVAVLATGVLIFFIWPVMGKRLTFSDWAVNLTMMQRGFNVPYVDGVYWTLWAEMRFYGLVLLLMMLGWVTCRRILAFAVVWPLLGFLAPLIPSNFVRQALIPEHAALFAGGICLFLIYRFGHTPWRWAALGLNVVQAAAWTGKKGTEEATSLVGYAIPEQAYWGIVVGIFVVIALLTLTPLSRVNLPGLALAGALTYPIYLLHEIWGWWIIDQLSGHLPRPVVLMIAIGAAAAGAYLVYRFVEQTLGRRLGRAVTSGVDTLTSLGRRGRGFAERVSRVDDRRRPAARAVPHNQGGITRGL